MAKRDSFCGLFFSKARFFGFLLNSNRKALAISISDNLLSLAAHRETVYDSSNAKVGLIEDVLVGQDGKVVAYILNVGKWYGGLGKYIAVPFQAMEIKKKDDSTWAVLFMTQIWLVEIECDLINCDVASSSDCSAARRWRGRSRRVRSSRARAAHRRLGTWLANRRTATSEPYWFAIQSPGRRRQAV